MKGTSGQKPPLTPRLFADNVWAFCLVSTGVGIVGCVGDDTTDVPTEVADISVLRFVEVGSSLGVSVDYDIDDDAAADYLDEHTGFAGDVVRMAAGMAVGDYNQDGWPDLFILRGSDSAQLLVNVQGVFLDVTEQRELDVEGLLSGPALADFNSDGYPDLLLPSIEPDRLQLLLNEEGDAFDVFDSGLEATLPTLGFAIGDADSDQDLDLFALRYGQVTVLDATAEEGRSELFWVNDGDAEFSDETASLDTPLVLLPQGASPNDAGAELSDGGSSRESIAQGFELATQGNFADIDGDGDSDLLLTQDFGGSAVMENRGDLSFRDISDRDELGTEPAKGAAVGDYDNDGDLDWFVSGIYAQRADAFEVFEGNRLYENDGDGNFRDATEDSNLEEGSFGFGACFADFNNDSLLDIFQVNGWGFLNPEVEEEAEEFTDDVASLFIQDIQDPGEFTEVADGARIEDDGEGRGVVCFDFDRDGDIDILIQNVGGETSLYENQLNPEQGSGANWLSVRLEAPLPNRDAIGARIWVTTGSITQMREVQIPQGYASQGWLAAHFGLRGVFEVDELRIEWPDGADDTIVEGVRTNQALVLRR